MIKIYLEYNPVITLSSQQARIARWYGKMMHKHSINNNGKRFEGRKSLEAHVQGALAEMAFAVYMDLHWPRHDVADGWTRADFLGVIDIKQTDHSPEIAHLIIRSDKIKPYIYVLACGKDNEFTFMGYADFAQYTPAELKELLQNWHKRPSGPDTDEDGRPIIYVQQTLEQAGRPVFEMIDGDSYVKDDKFGSRALWIKGTELGSMLKLKSMVLKKQIQSLEMR